MVALTPFTKADFDTLIAWIDSEVLLVQIAGNYFTYPLTRPQLEYYLQDDNSIAFNIIDVDTNKLIGHAEIIVVSKALCKIDKLIIGDTSNRGKGTGGLVINELLKYCFMQQQAAEVELNVHDFNIAGIKCYLRAGFTYTGKTMHTNFNGETWLANNMMIDLDKWLETTNTQG